MLCQNCNIQNGPYTHGIRERKRVIVGNKLVSFERGYKHGGGGDGSIGVLRRSQANERVVVGILDGTEANERIRARLFRQDKWQIPNPNL